MRYPARLVLPLLVATSAGCALIAGLEDHALLPNAGPDAQGDADAGEEPDVPEAPPPEPSLVIAGQASPRGIVADGTSLYWVNEADGTLRKLPLVSSATDAGVDAGDAGDDASLDAGGDAAPDGGADAGPKAAVLDTGLTAVRELYLSVGDVFVPFGRGSNQQTFLRRVRKDGAETRALVTANVPIGEAWESVHAATSDTHVYVGLNKQALRGEVLRVGRDLGLAGDAVSAPACSAAEPTLCRFATFDEKVAALLADASFVYVALAASKRIVRIPTAGGAAEPFASDQDGIEHLAADVQSIFWGTSAGSVVRLDKSAPGGVPTAMASGQGAVQWIVVDGTDVVWTAGRTVRRANRSLTTQTGAPFTIALDQSGPFGVAVTPTTIYWTNTDDGTIRSVKR